MSGCQWRLTLDFWRLNMKKGKNHSGSAGRALLLSSSDRETNVDVNDFVKKIREAKSEIRLTQVKLVRWRSRVASLATDTLSRKTN